MSYELIMQESWCDMHDDFTDIGTEKKKLESSSIIDSLGIGLKSTSISTSTSVSTSVSISSTTKSRQYMSEQHISELNETQQLSLGEILSLDFSKEQLNEIDILKHQIYVAGHLKKYVSQCLENSNNFDTELHLAKLEWLAKSSLFLAKKRLQKDIKFKKKLDHVQRNSYEFCESGNKCVYKDGKCNKKHFVYNYLYCDICELIRCITCENIKHTKEIFTSINTINYVFNHMHDEIVNI